MGGNFIEIDGMLVLQCPATALHAAEDKAIQVLPPAQLADVEDSAAALADMMEELSINLNPTIPEVDTGAEAGQGPLDDISRPQIQHSEELDGAAAAVSSSSFTVSALDRCLALPSQSAK
jgi:hypothetical protein